MPRCKSIPFSSLLSGLLAIAVCGNLQAQSKNDQVEELKSEVNQLRSVVGELESRLAALESREHLAGAEVRATGGPEDAAALSTAAATLRRASFTRAGGAASASASSTSNPSLAVADASISSPAEIANTPAEPHAATTLPGGATLNFYFDGYFENNFNNPTGRANDLRAYDVLSRTFSINQTDLILALEPDVKAGRRYGLRLDLQYGQATEAQQGNPANEPRPNIYRNIFQAYGTYVVPLGSGLNVDFGKWASSLGIEGNYSKDQMNYSRSFWFYFLPFYHAGARVHYDFNKKIGVNYWLVNGTNQTEPFKAYKDEMFGVSLVPAKNLNWTINYHLGQEHPDTVNANNCVVPLQPGLCFAPLSSAPNGKLHIIDSYATWNATPKLTIAGEADYVIQREWATVAPGESSAPMHDDGGAAYAQYQFSPRYALAVRSEYLSDRGGMFSNVTQSLKETTGTWRYNFADNFAAFLEYRWDWSNQPYFVTGNPASPTTHQDTAGIGLVWWYGQKQGAW